MIPNQEKTVNIQGSNNLVQARSEQMGIDQESLPHLMRVLTNLYSDPEMAVIREVSTNAYDSHVEAGKGDVPIRVKLPSVFSTEFVVKDFGVGMSETEVFEVFGFYGKSTKRESNDYVGQLGLGCKSPLTLTNQFSLTTIKGGIKCVFSVHLDEFGVGKITKLHEENTESVNGVEVSVPIKDVHSFIRKAKKFYRFFPIMPEFVGGINFPDELVPQVVLELDEGIRVIKSVYEDDNHDFVVMGGVAYPYRSGYQRKFNSGTVVMEAPIGSVDFTPSREELHLTKRTKHFIEVSYDKVKAAFSRRVNEKLASAKDIYEFHKFVEELSSDLRSSGIDTVEYQGLQVPLFSSYAAVLPKGCRVFGHDSYSDKFCERRTRLGLSSLDSTALVIDDTGFEEITSYTRARLKVWMRINNLSHILLILPNGEKPFEGYMDKILDAGNLTEIRKSANKHIKKTARSEKYERVTAFWANTPETQGDIPNTDDNTVVFAPRATIRKFHEKLSGVIRVEGIQVFVVNKSRKSTFQKEYPEAIQLDRYYYNMAEEVLNSIKDTSEKAAYAAKNSSSPFREIRLPYTLPLSESNFKLIEDEELREVLKFLEVYLGCNKGPFVNKYKNLIKDMQAEANFDADVSSQELTVLMDKSGKIGLKEVKGAADLFIRMQNKYPILLHQYRNEHYLVDYANIVAKGA